MLPSVSSFTMSSWRKSLHKSDYITGNAEKVLDKASGLCSMIHCTDEEAVGKPWTVPKHKLS